MYAPSPRSTPATRRRRQNGRGAMPVSRSGSFLNSLKSFVAKPLSWFGANDENVDENGKRRREASREREIEDLEEDRSQSKPKRARVESPLASPSPPKRVQTSISAYLDPPTSSLQPIQQNVNLEKDGRGPYLQHSATFGGLPSSMSRTMSIDPPSAFASMTMRRDPSTMSLSSPIEARSSMSLAPRELSRQPSSGPFKLRSSLTPQPSGARQLRREASAPPPPSSLQTRPIFVRAPDDEHADKRASRELRAHKTMSLGAYADFNRGTRAPSRDRTLTSYDSIGSVPPLVSASHFNDASKLQPRPSQSLSDKTFHVLEMYKTPIVPSRYKDSDAIPPFLRLAKAHVPLPMDQKDRELRPSLGLRTPEESRKSKKSAHHAGKPYGGRGGISKVIDKRKAEEEEDRRHGKRTLEVVEEDEEMDTDFSPSKRSVGVSAGMSESEDERSAATKKDVYAFKASEIGSAVRTSMDDPFKQQKISLVSGGRTQPYGRVGRTRVRDPGQRSVPLGRSSNRFSAVFDEEDDMDMVKMDASLDEPNPLPSNEETPKGAFFEAPKGFSFAQDTKPVEHQHEGAKEPPLQSLPFSFTNPAPSPDSLTENVRTPWIDTTIAPIASNDGEKVTAAPTLKKDVHTASPKPNSLFGSPAEMSNSLSKLSAPPASSITKPDTKEAKSAVPNFFANSAFLSKDERAISVPFSFGQSSAATLAGPTLKEVEKAPVPSSEGTLEAPKSHFSFGNPSAGAPSSQPATSLFKAQPKPVEATAPTATPPISLFGTSSKAMSQSGLLFPPPKHAEETSKESPAPTTPFSFNTSSATSAAPKPLFGFGPSSTTSTPQGSTSAQTSVPTQATPAVVEPKSHLTFSSTAPPAPPANGSTSEQKPGFLFGTAATPAKAQDGSSSATTNISAPKPLFGQASGSHMFNFGNNTSSSAPSASVDAPKSTPSPFAFGAAPATPPATNERQNSPFAFGIATQPPSSSPGTMFQFGPKPSEATPVVAASVPFAFNNPPRPVTPPPKPDEGMSMEESPTRMDTSVRPQGTISFGTGPTPANPFGQPSTPSSSTFPFGQPANTNGSNPFAPKVENNFNRTSSAPTISTSFSFGPKNDQPTPPATAFGTSSNPFGQPPQSSGSTTSTPFNFAQTPSTPVSNVFGAPSQSTPSTVAPSTPFGQPSTSSFTFGTPSSAHGNPFSFGSQPSSPANMPGGLPQSPASTAPQYAYGASAAAGPSFNIGAPPPSSGGTPGRQVKKLPNRARPPPKR